MKNSDIVSKKNRPPQSKSLNNKNFVDSQTLLKQNNNYLDRFINRLSQAVNALRNYNFKHFDNSYLSWIAKSEPSQDELAIQEKKSTLLEYSPLYSVIVPIFNASPEILQATLDSVCHQTYQNWELCLVVTDSDTLEIKNLLSEYAKKDSRFKIKFSETNLGFVANSNETIKLATGEFIVLLNLNDELAPFALFENAVLLNKHPQADMIYSDEDSLDQHGFRCDPHFKPDWSPDFFTSNMYTAHLGVYRSSLINEIGGFREGFAGAQDYDLVLRLIEKTNQIYHIPKVLYHLRSVENSTDTKLGHKASQIKAVSEHFQRTNINAEVTPGLTENLVRVRRKLFVQPTVSIIISTCDRLDLLENCVKSIQTQSSYSNYEIIIVDNNSSKTETFRYFERISQSDKIKVIQYPHPFNFSAINNFAADQANGELLLFLNNDTEVISNDWLESMVEHAVRPEIGAVGARLLYPNDTIQHAGVIIGIGGVAGHSHKYFSSDDSGYFSRAKAIQNVSAVTGACLMVKAETFKLLGGFNQENLPIAYNDIDFCLRLRQKGWLIVYTPYSELYHHESASRGSDQTRKNSFRLQQEGKYMLDYWKETLQSDPYYNPNLTLVREDFSLADSEVFL